MELDKIKNYKCSMCGFSPSGKKRSNQQSKYYWAVVVKILSEETGYQPYEFHEILKHRFLTEHVLVKSKSGKTISVTKSNSTSSLDTKEFEDLMSKIRIWASANLGIWIPEPNEVINA